MAAYHHIYLVTKICLSVSAEKANANNDPVLLLPEPYRDDFKLVYEEDYIRESPKLPDGTSLKWNKKDLTFALKNEQIKYVQDFLLASWKLIKEILDKERLVRYQRSIDDSIEIIKNIDIEVLHNENAGNEKVLIGELEKTNCGFREIYTKVSSYAVYDGMPEELLNPEWTFSFMGINILSSIFKLHEDRDETILFAKIKEAIQNQDSYNKLSKYIYHLGY